jgi:hypothetical protein
MRISKADFWVSLILFCYCYRCNTWLRTYMALVYFTLWVPLVASVVVWVAIYAVLISALTFKEVWRSVVLDRSC